MRYAQIRSMDISNGEGVGVSLFVQGCPFRCKDCFNKETWDFDGGYEWSEEIESYFLDLIKRPYIQRVSFLGGEPLCYSYEIWLLMNKIKDIRKDIKIWLYTGYTLEEIQNSREYMKTLTAVDILVDGRFETDKKDLTLAFRGSSNQRIIDVKKELFN